MNCSRPGGIYIAWTMRMRYCDICVSTSDIFGTIEQALSQGGHPGRVLISNFVPALHCKGNVDLFVRSEVEAFVDTLMELQVRGAPPDVVSAWLELQRRRCRQAYEHMMWLDEWKRERDKIHLEAETREACRVWAQATYKKAVQPRIMGRFDSLVFECVVC
ncbi:hypothetical protein BD626DRAFT_521806 [Schizophyllum amplum]|uniref:Uncharacterized protein n=1 Tax=Schizophyllum amplum TaxID=97359 RepID=A0A550BTI3_9AGAR|nr:hypothetical protein BD626DRAFT_521806 [Auriculariopsis ampla]